MNTEPVDDARYHTLLEWAADAILMLDADGNYVEVNAQACTLLGYSRDELLRLNVRDIVPAGEQLRQPLRFAELTVGPALLTERPVRRKDGSVIPTENNSRRLPDGRIVSVMRDISARYGGAARPASAPPFQAVFEQCPDALLIVDDERRYLDVNAAACALYGLPRAAIIGRRLDDFMVGEGAADLAAAWQTLLSAGQVQGEFQIRQADGGLCDTEFSAVAHILPGQHLGLTHDITARKQAEAALRHSEERFAGIFHASPDALSLTRLADGRVMDVNAAWSRLFGLDHATILAQPLLQDTLYADPADAGRVRRLVREHGGVRDLELKIRLPSGEPGYCLASLQIVEFGGERYILTVTRDITERKRAVAAHILAEDRFAKAFRASPDALLISRVADGQVLDANQSCLGLTGYSREEFLGASILDLQLWADPAAREQMLTLFYGQGYVRDFEMDLRRKSGEIRQTIASIDWLEIEGEPYFLTILHDVTDRKAMEERARAAERLGALGRVAAGVAHEFNNVLAGIIGRLDLLALEVREPGAAIHLRLIQQAAADGAAMVARIQRFARLREPGAPESIALEELVADVLDLTRPRWKTGPEASGRPITLRTHVTPGLLAQGNPTQLREVLTNLILNAVDALPGGGEIIIEAAPQDGAVRLTVSDTGLGMDATTQARIFEPFYTTKLTGSGLGLALVKSIVESHGGTIDVVSQPGVGTVFSMRLPGAASAPVPAAPPGTTPAQRPARILAVDDNPALGEMLQAMLAAGGHKVVVATNGAEALGYLAQEPFDLVCTDLGMPDMSGWEVARRVHALAPGTPVVLITGWGAQIDPAELAAGAVDFLLPKPYRLADVQAVIAQALAQPPAKYD
jgi:PAS domain S-box-containing protein